jgi:broad specificity phosphatase PhoE
MEVFFVRHGQTQMIVEEKYYDNNTKKEYYPITERGKLQAIETGKYLNKYGQFDAVYSSPRDRCIQTANNIINQLNITNFKIITDNLLLEGTAGLLNGLTHDEANILINSFDQLKNLKN